MSLSGGNPSLVEAVEEGLIVGCCVMVLSDALSALLDGIYHLLTEDKRLTIDAENCFQRAKLNEMKDNDLFAQTNTQIDVFQRYLKDMKKRGVLSADEYFASAKGMEKLMEKFKNIRKISQQEPHFSLNNLTRGISFSCYLIGREEFDSLSDSVKHRCPYLIKETNSDITFYGLIGDAWGCKLLDRREYSSVYEKIGKDNFTHVFSFQDDDLLPRPTWNAYLESHINNFKDLTAPFRLREPESAIKLDMLGNILKLTIGLTVTLGLAVLVLGSMTTLSPPLVYALTLASQNWSLNLLVITGFSTLTAGVFGIFNRNSKLNNLKKELTHFNAVHATFDSVLRMTPSSIS